MLAPDRPPDDDGAIVVAGSQEDDATEDDAGRCCLCVPAAFGEQTHHPVIDRILIVKPFAESSACGHQSGVDAVLGVAVAALRLRRSQEQRWMCADHVA